MKQFKYTINDNIYNVTVNSIEDAVADIEVNGTSYKVLMDKPAAKPVAAGAAVRVSTAPVVPAAPVPAATVEIVKAPLPGIILSIDCKVGDTVEKGQGILVLEAMKMENTITAERDGVITEIKVEAGNTVLEGTDLVYIK